MKYELSIDLELPRDRVIALFDGPENLKKWMPGSFRKRSMKHMEDFKRFAEEPKNAARKQAAHNRPG